MNKYEIMFIVKPDVEEEARNTLIERKGVDRQYVVNITQLHEIIHDVNILFSMINGKKRR